MHQTTGDKLTPEDQATVLRTYVHRFTGEHRPEWANAPMSNGERYQVQFADDAEWLANTWFVVTWAGRLDRRVRSCRSVPTWPNSETA